MHQTNPHWYPNQQVVDQQQQQQQAFYAWKPPNKGFNHEQAWQGWNMDNFDQIKHHIPTIHDNSLSPATQYGGRERDLYQEQIQKQIGRYTHVQSNNFGCGNHQQPNLNRPIQPVVPRKSHKPPNWDEERSTRVQWVPQPSIPRKSIVQQEYLQAQRELMQGIPFSNFQ
jgi:hypothetical protein